MADVADVERRLADTEKEVAELRQELDQEVGRLNRLLEVTTLLTSTLKLEEVLELILSSASDVLDAETSSLFLLDDDTGELSVVVATGQPAEEVVEQRVPAGEGIAGWVVANQEAADVADPASDERFYRGIDEKTGFETRNLLAAPLRTRERVIGVVEVINKRSGTFSERDVELATALASHAAVAVDNARLYAGLADAVVTSRLSYRL
jgi:GAF domain-containing protein